MDREDVKMLVKKWWDIFDDDLFSYKTPPLEENVGANRVQITESNIVAQELSEKEKTGLRPMVTAVLKVPAS